MVLSRRSQIDVQQKSIGTLSTPLNSITFLKLKIDYNSASPKREIYLGHSSEGFAIHEGTRSGYHRSVVSSPSGGNGFVFTIQSPARDFILSSNRLDERTAWIRVY